MFGRHQDQGSNFTLGILSGAIVGAGLALLFAPKAGRQLRSELAGSVESLRDAVAERYASLAATAGVELSDLHDTITTATDAVESRARTAVETAAQRVREATNASA